MHWPPLTFLCLSPHRQRSRELADIIDIIVDRIAFLLTYFSVGMTNAVEAMALGKQLRQIQMQLQSLIGALAVYVAQSILFSFWLLKVCAKRQMSQSQTFSKWGIASAILNFQCQDILFLTERKWKAK